MVHDLPQFLEGGLRDRTTHILIKVRNEKANKNLKQRQRRTSMPSTKDDSYGRESWVNDEQEEKQRRLSFSKTVLTVPEVRHSMGETFLDVPVESHFSLAGIKREIISRPISPALCEVLNRVDSNSIQLPCRSATPDLTGYHIWPRSVSVFENYSTIIPPTIHRSRSALDNPLQLTGSSHSRQADPCDCSADANELLDEEEEVHLYTLSTSTHLFHLLHSLWMASLLVTYPEVMPKFSLPPDVHLNEISIEQTFRSLCDEMREASLVEQHTHITQDLLQGLKKYSAVRRVFWRDTEGLSLIRTHLKKYSFPMTNNSLDADDEVLERRVSEIKVIILSLKVIASSLSHSQGCPFKSKALNSKILLQELLKEIFDVPEIPPHHSAMCKRFLSDFKELSEGAWQSLPERELILLVQKTIRTGVAAAYYLIEAVFELGWREDTQEGPFINITKIGANTTPLNILLQYVSIDKWLSYAMPQLLLLVASKANSNAEGILARKDAILIYQFLAVLVTLLKKSPKALAFSILNYSEELRYFVNESILKQKFDSSDPLTPHSFRLAKSISKLVVK